MNIGIIQSHVFDSLRTDMTGQDIAQFDRKLAFRYLDQRIPIFIVPYHALKGHGSAWRRRQAFHRDRTGKELAFCDDLVEDIRRFVAHVETESVKNGGGDQGNRPHAFQFSFMSDIPFIPHVLPSSLHSYH